MDRDKERVISVKYLLMGVGTVLFPLLTAIPTLAHEICTNSLEGSSTSNSKIKIGCFRDGLRETILLAQETGKPLLTEDSLNALISADPKSPEFSALATAAKSNLQIFIRSNFSLTLQQEQAIYGLTQEDIALIQQTIDEALLTGTPLHVEINPPTSSSEPDSSPKIQVLKVSDNLSSNATSTLIENQGSTTNLFTTSRAIDDEYKPKGRTFIIFRC